MKVNRRSFMRAALLGGAGAATIVALPSSVSYFFMSGRPRWLSLGEIRSLEISLAPEALAVDDIIVTLEYAFTNGLYTSRVTLRGGARLLVAVAKIDEVKEINDD